MMNNKKKNTAIITAGGVLLVGATLLLQNYMAKQGIELPQEEAETSAEEPEEIPLAPLVDAEWKLTASYNWSEPKTNTNIDFIFESIFDVVDGKIKPVSFPLGNAFGDAGINVNGECLETQPLEIDFTYVLAGKAVKMAQTDLIGKNDFSHASVEDGQVQVLEVEPKSAVIGSISLPPFTKCAPDMDQEFLEGLATFWITMIPFLEVEYRRLPLAAGVHCPGTIIFDEGTYSELTPCYNLINLKNP